MQCPVVPAAAFTAAVAAAILAAPLSAQTVTVDTATGPVELPHRPEAVVAFDVSAIDTLTALGVTLAGVPAPIFLETLERATADAARVGTLFEPDFEALAAMAPDLIVAGGRSSAQVAPLSRIAPTADMTIWGDGMVAQAMARTAAYGEIFGKPGEAAALNAALEARIDEAAKAVAGNGDALILLTNGGKISAYGADSRFGWLHQALDLPEAHPGLSAETHGQAVSFEFIAEVDPDWLLVIDRGAAIGAEGEAAAATLDNPLVAGTSAAQAGRIVYLDSGPLYIAGGGHGAMMGTLAEIVEAFATPEG
jgi:iron complex transport system substrate-binding protein